MLPRFHGGHLFKEIFASEKADRGEEGDNTDPHAKIASVPVVIEETGFPSFCPVVSPTFGGNAAEYDDGEELGIK